MIAGCTSVSAVLDLPLARRPSTSVHAVAMEDGDSLAPALSAGGQAARDLREAGAREAGAEVLAGRCGGHQACLGRLVGVQEPRPVPNGAIFHSSLMIRPPPSGPASPLPLPSPLPPHTRALLPPSGPASPAAAAVPPPLPLKPYSRLKLDEGTDLLLKCFNDHLI